MFPLRGLSSSLGPSLVMIDKLRSPRLIDLGLCKYPFLWLMHYITPSGQRLDDDLSISIVQLTASGSDERRKCLHLSLLSEGLAVALCQID